MADISGSLSTIDSALGQDDGSSSAPASQPVSSAASSPSPDFAPGRPRVYITKSSDADKAIDVLSSGIDGTIGKNDPKAELASGLAAGKHDDPVSAAAWRTNQGTPPANITDAAINGATMGWGDEASAALRAPIDMATRGEGFGEAYEHNLAAERERLAQFQQDHPNQALTGEVLGSLATGGGTMSPIKAGALFGGIAGAGNSEGDLKDRAIDAGKGALGGAIAGGVVQGGANLIKGVLSPITKNVVAAAKPEGRAVDQLARDLARDKVTPAAAKATLAEAQASGQPMTIADLGNRNVMGLTRAVATGKSEGSNLINSMMDARKMDTPARVSESLKSALGNPDAFQDTLEKLTAQRKTTAAPIYEAAYAKPAPDTQVIRDILSRPAGKLAVTKAAKLSANEGMPFEPNVRGLDLVKRSLDDMISTAQRSGKNEEVRALTGMKNTLLKEVDKTVPEYGLARKTWSSDFELEQAVERGKSLLKDGTSPEVAAKEIRDMSPPEKEVARIGMARELKSWFDDPSRSLSQINKVLNSDRVKTITKAMFPTQQSYDQFRAELTREAVMLRRGQQVTGGSPTANKLAEVDDAGVLGPAAKTLFEGKPVAAIFSAAANIGKRAVNGINEKTANSLGEMLSSVDPARQKEILDQIEKLLPRGTAARLLGQISAKQEGNVRRALP